jgi:hypothetical protein
MTMKKAIKILSEQEQLAKVKLDKLDKIEAEVKFERERILLAFPGINTH